MAAVKCWNIAVWGEQFDSTECKIEGGIMLQSLATKVFAHNVLLKRIGSVIELTDQERDLIKTYAARCESRAKGTLIAEEGDASRRSCFLVSGWALRQTFLADGRRQIFGFILPGDPLEPFSCLGEVVPGGIVAVTSVDLVDAGRAIGTQNAKNAHDLDRFYFLVAREHLRFTRNQLLRLGCHNAYQRVAHFLLELHDRLSMVGMVTDGSFAFPLTQEMLADALGLSVVHVSRTMKQLREADLVHIKDGQLQLRHRRRLSALSEYVSLVN
jgi:CRP-like cAMP-binding protein